MSLGQKLRLALAGSALCLAATLPAPASAEQKACTAGHCVHYTVMNSTDLLPAVARDYGITRSRNRGLIVLSPMQRRDGAEHAAESTAVGVARNLIGHRQTLEFRALREGSAFYLVATFEISNQEFLHFDLQVAPRASDDTVSIRFDQQFFTD